MCVQCKGLTGCSKNGCTPTSSQRLSVAELLAQAFSPASARQSGSPSPYRGSMRREITSRMTAAS